MRGIVIGFLLVFVPVIALGNWAQGNRNRGSAGYNATYTLCGAETDTGICESTFTTGWTGTSQADIFLSVDGYIQDAILYDDGSTATSFSCQLYQSPTATSTDAYAVTGALVTNSSGPVHITGQTKFLYANCSTISGGNVTLKLSATVITGEP
jgi:hypothetical protein